MKGVLDVGEGGDCEGEDRCVCWGSVRRVRGKSPGLLCGVRVWEGLLEDCVFRYGVDIDAK